jgi:hypothetical protein
LSLLAGCGGPFGFEDAGEEAAETSTPTGEPPVGTGDETKTPTDVDEETEPSTEEEPGTEGDVTKLLASDGQKGDHFGRAVSISGDTALVGALNPQLAYRKAGAAYVFVRNGDTWSEQAKLTPAGAESRDMFGEVVSLDGDTAIVSARGDDDTGPNSGAVYVFVREGTSWRQQAKLTHTPEGDDRFANAVSVSGDTALVGAYRSNTEQANYAGAVYVFTRSGETWSQQAKLYAGDGHSSQWFGQAVSIDGDTAIIGASGDGAVAEAAGSAYVFKGSGGSWTEQAKLTASDAEEDNGFGYTVDVDGDTAIVGVRTKKEGDVSSMGAAYVFARSGSSWSQQIKLSPDDLPSDAEWGELFGKAGVGIDEDTAVVAAAGSTESHTGKVYVYDRNGTTWTRQTILVEVDPLPYPAINASEFASSLGIDDNRVVVGALGHDGTAPGAGAAFIFGI